METWAAAPATREAFVLAEGPLWDAPRSRLLWVDIQAGAVLVGALDGATVDVRQRLEFDSTVGAVVAAADGALLVAAHDRLVSVEADGRRTQGVRLLPEGSRRRLNDGKVDPAGRFLVGSMTLGEDPSQEETLVRVEDGRVTVLDDDLTLSNGLAWSVDSRTMFSVDTTRHVVFSREYDVATGLVGPRRVHLEMGDGMPDGICVDAEDHLWVALWGAGEVRRYSPRGDVVGRVEVAAPHTSSVAFAGEDLELLVVTTATDELTDEQRRAFPDSGRLFTAKVGVPGLPATAWARAPRA